MKTNNRGAIPVIYFVAVGLAAVVALFVAKPKFLHGESNRAATSTQTTEQLIDTTKKQGAEAASSVTKIGEANATAPDSKEKEFIAKEVPVALSKLPAPDPLALLEAEKRKNAVLTGNIEATNSLYDKAMKHADELEQKYTAAVAAKRGSDLKLEQVAAEHLGAERTKDQMILLAAIAVGLYLYVKFTHLSPAATAEMVADMKAKGLDISHIDSVTTRLQQLIIRTINKLKS